MAHMGQTLSQGGHGPGAIPSSQPVQSALLVRGHVPLDGGPTQVRDLARLGSGEATVKQPEDQHLAANVGLGVGISLGVDDDLLGIREGDPKPCHA